MNESLETEFNTDVRGLFVFDNFVLIAVVYTSSNKILL